jgi:hypothetical protein
MPDGLRRRIEQLIEEDAGGQAYAEFLQDFYHRLEKDSATFPSERVDEFVEELFRDEKEGTVVPLHPFQSRREGRPTVLAAETASTKTHESSEERRFSILTTLAAETEDLLVRVVEDRDTGRGRLYVLADPPEQRAHVVVSFPEFGLDLVADEEGRRAFDVPPEVSPEQWAEARAVVRRPVATRALGPSEDTAIPLESGGTLVGKRLEEALKVEIESQGADALSLLTVTSPDRSVRLFWLDGSSLKCEISPESPLVLRVYE